MRLQAGMFFLSWGDDEDHGVELLRQAVEDFHHAERAFAFERRGPRVAKNQTRAA
jgi:hypothetical protein